MCAQLVFLALPVLICLCVSALCVPIEPIKKICYADPDAACVTSPSTTSAHRAE